MGTFLHFYWPSQKNREKIIDKGIKIVIVIFTYWKENSNSKSSNQNILLLIKKWHKKLSFTEICWIEYYGWSISLDLLWQWGFLKQTTAIAHGWNSAWLRKAMLIQWNDWSDNHSLEYSLSYCFVQVEKQSPHRGELRLSLCSGALEPPELQSTTDQAGTTAIYVSQSSWIFKKPYLL